jgi:hypothetical protein
LIEAFMGDARFFARTGPYALAGIANAAVRAASAIQRIFAGVAPLQSAGLGEVNFLDNRRYATALGWCGRRTSTDAGTGSRQHHSDRHNGV